MPGYIAFLRAINLGAQRRFPKDEVRACVEAAGGTEVATYLNTGNVRLQLPLRSRHEVAELLERTFAADRGFEVPTIVFTPAELTEVGVTARELRIEYGEPGTHYITLYQDPPDSRAVAEVAALDYPGERMVVAGRSAHALLKGSTHGSRVLNSGAVKALGQGTARTFNVVTTLIDRWC